MTAAREPEADPEDGSVSFEYEGSLYKMVLDMKAIAFFEREAEMSIITAIEELDTAARGKTAPKVSLLAYLMQAGLRRHHPEVTAEKAMRMAGRAETQEALGLAVKTASGPPSEGEGRKPAHPRKKSKRST